MPDIKDSFDISKKSNPLWISYLRKHFGSLTIDVISQEENLMFQDKKWGDFLIILDQDIRSERFQTVEVKTRREKYYQAFLTDNKIALEIMGNVEKMKTGSAFLDSKADLYANGFITDPIDYIRSPKIFYVPELQDWFNVNQHKYSTISSTTNSIYTTYFKLVPLRDIPLRCICPTLEEQGPLSVANLFWRK